MNNSNFNKKWAKAKFLWKLSHREIRKIRNEHHREVYDDMYYRKLYFFTLKEAKDWIKKGINLRTPDGHENNATLLKDYIIIKTIRR